MNAPQTQIAQATAGDRDRTTYIGGGAIPIVLGVSPFKTRLQFYREVTGECPEEITAEKALFFKRRKRQEPIISETLSEDKGYVVTRLSTNDNPNRYDDPEVPYFAAEIDAELAVNTYLCRDYPEFVQFPDGTCVNAEFKTVHPLAAADFGEDGSDRVPIYYTAQVQWGLGVTGRPAALLVAMIGFDDIRCYPILRDDELIADMRAAASLFWQEHVVAGVPPAPTTLEDAKLLFARFNGRPVELEKDDYDALEELFAQRAAIRYAEDEKDRLETKIALAIAKAWQLDGPDTTADNAVLRYQGRDVATWKLTRGSYLDQKRLKVDMPELINQYTVTHFYRAFRAKKQ